MILYVNGDSHTAAAEAVNPHAFAEDDGQYWYLKRHPHPDNLAISWGKLLADRLKAGFHCGAESASSNTRIIRTTREWLQSHTHDAYRTLVIIQWSTWERQEWLINGEYYQVNASGIDDVPESHQQQYKEFIADVDWQQCQQHWHKEILQFHQELNNNGIKHVFFNGNTAFDKVFDHHDWGSNYIEPYNSEMTYHSMLQNNGIDTVAPNSYHYGPDAHRWWAQYLVKYLATNNMV